MDVFTWSLPFVGEKITEMLVAVLNCCSKEELDESSDEEQSIVSPATAARESAERRQIIKNKILAVGRISRVFSLLREESERVSELKNVSGSGKLPYGTLALGAEGIKDAITSFDDARKSDIENERLPPELVDPENVAPHLSSPATPIEDIKAVPSPNGIKAAIEAAVANGSIAHPSAVPAADSTSTPMSPVSPGSNMMPSPSAFRRGHGRAASLGTTMTSPSTRRRSIESTISLIKEAVDGKQEENELTELADQLSSPTKDKASNAIGAGGGSGVKPGER